MLHDASTTLDVDALRTRPNSDRTEVSSQQTASSIILLTATTIVVGLAAGLSGMILGLMLHMIQHLAFGYSIGNVIGTESFLDGVEAASASRRVMVVVSCGLAAGLGWAALYRYGKPLISISQAISAGHPRMPVLSTTCHAILQIVTVALGSPLGREVAPREIGALFAEALCHRLGLTPSETRVLVACGAGAGLAAVYNVPLAATVFVLEVLLRTTRRSAVVQAFACCLIAALFARIGLGNESQYAEADFQPSLALVAWAIVFGPIFGIAGHSFKRAMARAQFEAPRGSKLIVASVVSFSLVALLSAYFPQLLGNGKGPAQLTFAQDIDPRLAAELLFMKIAIIAVVLRGGARGGLLTPGLATGALLATVLGALWSIFLPQLPMGAVAVVGASAFLGASMAMPLTAIVLMMEFMSLPVAFSVPLALAAAGATLTRITIQKRAVAISAAVPAASV